MAGHVEVIVGVAVNGREWTFVTSLQNARPTDNVFTIITEDGVSTIIFGDGTHGAVPPAGSNITATYRSGGGTAGNISTGNISRRIENESDLQKFWFIVRQDIQDAGWGKLDNLLARTR
jgi:hypothetical protein